MPNKEKPLDDRHAPKNGVGSLIADREWKIGRFTNDTPTAHAQWVEVETRLLRGGGQLVIRSSDAGCAITPSQIGNDAEVMRVEAMPT